MKNEDKYYVYSIHSDSKLLYIGKGCGGRMETHLEGKSNNVDLNALFFSGEELYGVKIKEGLSNARAKLLEAQLIKMDKPPCNKVVPRITEDIYLEAIKDLRLKWTYDRVGEEQEPYLVDEGNNPLVWVKRSPNYVGLSHLRFPTQLPLKWCGDHYRLEGKDLVGYGYDFDKEDNIGINESLYIPPSCF